MDPLDALLAALPSSPPAHEQRAWADAWAVAQQEARAAHPGIALDPVVFARELGRRIGEGTLDSVHVADLYLAIAALHDHARAQQRIHDLLRALAAKHLARYDRSAGFAEDVMQELAFDLLTARDGKPGKLDGYSGRGPLGTFLRVSLVRGAQAVLRRRKPSTDEIEGLEHGGPSAEAAYLHERHAETFRQALEQVLATLEPSQRAMLKSHYLRGATLEEVAAAHGVSRATAARRLAEAKASIVQRTLQLLRGSVQGSSPGALLAWIQGEVDLSLSRHLETNQRKST